MVKILDQLQKQDERLKNIENLLSLSKTVLNIDEVSKLTGLSKSTIYKFTHKGKIPHYKQAKHLFFDRVEVENWLKAIRGFNSEEIEKQASSYVILNRRGGRS
ncbi:MAG: helix-turn-helix domain-containing protein [Bacteroidales bacterium]|nr:helix-turn-helix domain-containing protein [Bacteroidales bacterium]